MEKLKADKYDEIQITPEKYKDILFKFYAFLRHQMYVMV